MVWVCLVVYYVSGILFECVGGGYVCVGLCVVRDVGVCVGYLVLGEDVWCGDVGLLDVEWG